MGFYPARLLSASLAGDTGNGNGLMRVARATYDFAVDGGAIGPHTLGVTLPVGAIVTGGFIDVITTCVTAGADAGTMAISVQAANDIVTATAVVTAGDIWDAGRHAIAPKSNTPETTSVKVTTTAKLITATIAVQAFTAGKFIVFLNYVLSE